MALEQNRFLQPPQPPAPRRKIWAGCWGGLSCFRKQKGGTRIVPAARLPEGNNQQNGPQAVGLLPNQTNGVIALSLLAPPSSPASFSNSALASTAQSPSCFLSANSPGGPSSTMFVTGPYAHETQLVSPPVFSTFTTEPSTAPLTPPPELAHLTTPSSPEVPYAHFLTSSSKIKATDKAGYISRNDLQSTYSLYPESPSSTLIRSPASRMSNDLSSSFNERDIADHWNSDSGRFLGVQSGGSKPRQDSNFFCPETFAQFYEQSSLSNNGGRLSISKESDSYTTGHHNRQMRTTPRADAEELEAYRASFGFSADEITTTTHYVEITDVLEDNFSIAPPSTSNKPVVEAEQHVLTASGNGSETNDIINEGIFSPKLGKAGIRCTQGSNSGTFSYNREDQIHQKPNGDAKHILYDDDDLFSKMGHLRIGCKHHHYGLSNSDAEIEYRRGRSLREGRIRASEH